MKMPIMVNENGDVSTYASVEEAEKNMEAIDVENGEYVVTDGDGRQLTLKTVIEEMPVLWGLWKARVKKVRIER